MKTCRRCKVAKRLEDFSPARRELDTAWCRACSKEYNAERHRRLKDEPSYQEQRQKYRERNRERINASRREYFARNPGLKRLYHLRSSYGLTLEQAERIVAMQENGCAICGRNPDGGRRAGLYIDHDHATGEVRGMLCNPCNAALGFLEDNIERMEAMIKYLRNPPTRTLA